MALAGGLIFDLAGCEESQQNGPSGAVRIFVFSHMCPSPLHAFVMPARLNPVLAQGAWRVANVAKKDMRGLVKGCGARLSSKEPFSLLLPLPWLVSCHLHPVLTRAPVYGGWVQMCQPWLPPHLMLKSGWKTCQQNVSFFLREEIENLYWRETKPRGRKLMAEKLCLQT